MPRSRQATRHLFVLPFVCLALLLAGPAQAQVYKCRTKSGKLIFADSPCENGTKEPFSLGAKVENKTTNGTDGDISGSFGIEDKQVTFIDAMGFYHNKNHSLNVIFSPEKFSETDIETYRKQGDSRLMLKRPNPVPGRWQVYPFMELVLTFRKGEEPTQESLQYLKVMLYGPLGQESPLVFEFKGTQARSVMPFLIVFRNITQGDVQLELNGTGERNGHMYDFHALIRAPIYLP